MSSHYLYVRTVHQATTRFDLRMVDNFYTFLSPDNTCRWKFCDCELSKRLIHGTEQYDTAKDHTKHGVDEYSKPLVSNPMYSLSISNTCTLSTLHCCLILEEDVNNPSRRSTDRTVPEIYACGYTSCNDDANLNPTYPNPPMNILVGVYFS